ncbi:urease accessory protein UreD [Streptomyces albidoflavus]|uniref:Urease accessory protein UreH-like protein n=1 Tax=Streptomyces koyangensis TaxID=188770 RepID=A0A385D8J4_9ACTN|nr:urease accessory protein UreD [Streptomyces koyangensis]AXQ54231.1 urease accessory protein UreH-like protein [Streptomyces koyangensis]WTD06004.1 urease accessory protein UreD [Streptomyces albidoflavus]
MTGPTRLSVAPTGSRSRVHHATGHLTVRVMDQDADGARVGLLATQALLLSGDDVRVEVDVAPGAWLDLVETTGTIAYEGEAPSSWTVDATVGDGAVLTWAGRPFVVSDQIATHRRTRVRLHGTGRALMQEKVVLGRAGQAGGDLTMSLEASDDTGPVQVEHLDLGQQARRMPGVLGNLRSMDTVTALGWTPEPAGEPEAGTTGTGETYFPLDRSGAVLRWMGVGRFRDQLCDATFAAWREEAMRDYRHRPTARHLAQAETGPGERGPAPAALTAAAGCLPARTPCAP